jgi:hypothetical protein
VPSTMQLALKFEGQPSAVNHNVNVYNGSGQLIFSKLVDTRDCTGGICTVYVPYDGSTGEYQVWMQAISGLTGSSWAQSRFNVVDGFLTPVKLKSPQGTVQGSTVLPLTFWAQAGVTSHNVNVYGPGGLVLETTVPIESCAVDGLCTLEMPYDGSDGAYSAWIQPQARLFGGPWAGSSFSVGNVGIDAVSLNSPSGTILPSDLLLLTFDGQQGVTDHTVNVYGPGGLIEALDVNTSDCAGEECAVWVPYDGTEGLYNVWIQPRSGGIGGPWNGSSFTVAEGSLNAVSLTSPSGTIAPGNQLALVFDTQGGTTSHQVQVTGPSGVIYNANVNTVDCSGAACVVKVPYSGQAGNYTVGITPYRGTTAGTNNDSVFAVGGAINPVSLTSPVGSIPASSQLTLSFNAQGGTTAHRIDVYGPNGMVSGKLYDTVGCAGATCNIQVPYDGAIGNYSVWILPYAGNNTGGWNGSFFAVEAAQLASASEYLSDNLTLTSVCAGTWEVGNPLDTEITLAWEAYFDDGDVQNGSVTVGGNDTTTFYTDPAATGVSLIIEGAADVYAETSAVCEE